MKRIIPFISFLISFAHAQVERFDVSYLLQVQQASSSSSEKLPVTARDLNHAALTLDKRLRALKAKKAKVTVKGKERILVTINELTIAPYEGQLDVELNKKGAALMFELTNGMEHGRDRLAIILDGKALSAPVVQSPLSKRFQISGMGSAKKAQALAAALLNPLKNPLTIESETITPSHLATDPSKKAAP